MGRSLGSASFAASGMPVWVDAEAHRADVAALIGARALPDKTLFADWFGGVAWDLMLELYLAHLDRHPFTTESMPRRRRASLHLWMDVIVAEGFAERDGESYRLSDYGTEMMCQYFIQLAAL